MGKLTIHIAAGGHGELTKYDPLIIIPAGGLIATM
jgi:hypothetical protein